jgi:hemerythrin-like domain-containing protein
MDNVVTLIKADHATFEWYFGKLESEDTETDEKTQLLGKLEALLKPHSDAEEEVVYPAIAAAVPAEGEETDDGAAEHHHVEGLMTQLKAQPLDAPGADGIMAAMIGELRHHIEEEEQDILPAYQKAADSGELDAVGRAFVQAKEKVRVAHGFPEAERPDLVDLTRDDLYKRARQDGVDGRSDMSKDELVSALGRAYGDA